MNVTVSSYRLVWHRDTTPLPLYTQESLLDTDLVITRTQKNPPRILRFVMPATILTELTTPVILRSIDIDFIGSSILPCTNSTSSTDTTSVLLTRLVVTLNDRKGNLIYVDYNASITEDGRITLELENPIVLYSSDQVINFYLFNGKCNEDHNSVVIPTITFHYIAPYHPVPPTPPTPPKPSPTPPTPPIPTPPTPSPTPSPSTTTILTTTSTSTSTLGLILSFLLGCFIVFVLMMLLKK